jgi:CheY-like chemotaxis protein
MGEGARPSVLLVEDDAEVRSSVAEILELEGFAVDTAIHGQQALEKLRSGALPNVMLLDLMMPVMNGLELLEHLRTETDLGSPPVIVLSANRGYDADDLGVAAVVRKPFDVDALVGNIAAVLRNSGRPPPGLAPASP